MKQTGMTEKNRQERMCLYRRAKEKAERVLRVIDRVLDGETETTACLMEDVDKNWIRRFARNNISVGLGSDEPDTMVHIKLKDWICWQDEFLTHLTGEECYAPEDFDQVYKECVVEACTEEEQEVLRLRFQEGMTLREIGEKIGKSDERARQIESKVMRKLRYPSRRLPLVYGKGYWNLMAEVRSAQAKYDKARMIRIQELKEEREAASRKLAEKLDQIHAETEAIATADGSHLLDSEKLDQIHAETEAIATADGSHLLDSVSKIPVSKLGLSARAMNALSCPSFCDRRGYIRRNQPIETVGQLSKLSHKELCSIRNIGRGTVKEIENALYNQYGIIISTIKD